MGKGHVRAQHLHRALDAEIGKSGSDWSRLPDVATLFPTCGFRNIVLIDLQMPHARWVASADMWTKLGRHVKTGQAIRILLPTRSRTSKAGALEAAGRKYGMDGLVELQVIGFHVAVMYDVKATDLPPIHLPRTPSPANASVARALGEGSRRRPRHTGSLSRLVRLATGRGATWTTPPSRSWSRITSMSSVWSHA